MGTLAKARRAWRATRISLTLALVSVGRKSYFAVNSSGTWQLLFLCCFCTLATRDEGRISCVRLDFAAGWLLLLAALVRWSPSVNAWGCELASLVEWIFWLIHSPLSESLHWYPRPSLPHKRVAHWAALSQPQHWLDCHTRLCFHGHPR